MLKKRHVETGSKPNPSPYRIYAAEGNDASQVEVKVEAVNNNKVVKNHITGTPARTKPTRKFGTMIQPANQSKDSVEERVEAPPTRAQSVAEARSPEPMMVTGGLAKICSIM